MEGSTQGWSKERRRQEINRILDHVIEKSGLTQTEVYTLIGNRVGAKLNTVQGWRESRNPPAWPVLDMLRYEFKMNPVLNLLAIHRAKK